MRNPIKKARLRFRFRPGRSRDGDDWSNYFQRPSRAQRRQEQRSNRRVCTVFFSVLFLLSFISLIIPLRPSYSDLEQRNLTAFPRPTAAG